jgi:hypothetical protein
MPRARLATLWRAFPVVNGEHDARQCVVKVWPRCRVRSKNAPPWASGRGAVAPLL